MRILTKKALETFWQRYPDAKKPLLDWHNTLHKGVFKTFVELKVIYPKTDMVGHLFVFNIGGNKYRLIAALHFNAQRVYVREVLTHAEYDNNDWKTRH